MGLIAIMMALAAKVETCCCRAARAFMNIRYLLFSLDGRIGRRAYWLGMGILAIVTFGYSHLLNAVERINETTGPHWWWPFLVILSVPVTIFIDFLLFMSWMAVSVKRLHDRNKTGLFFLLSFVPVLGQLWSLIELGLLKGTDGPNRYGEKPGVKKAAPENPASKPVALSPGASAMVPGSTTAASDASGSTQNAIAPPSDRAAAELVERVPVKKTDAMQPGKTAEPSAGHAPAKHSSVPQSNRTASSRRDLARNTYAPQSSKAAKPSVGRDSAKKVSAPGSGRAAAASSIQDSAKPVSDPGANRAAEKPGGTKTEADNSSPSKDNLLERLDWL